MNEDQAEEAIVPTTVTVHREGREVANFDINLMTWSDADLAFWKATGKLPLRPSRRPDLRVVDAIRSRVRELEMEQPPPLAGFPPLTAKELIESHARLIDKALLIVSGPLYGTR